MPTNHLAKIKNSANLGLWASAAYCRNQNFPLEMALFVLLGIKSERTLIYHGMPGVEVVPC